MLSVDKTREIRGERMKHEKQARNTIDQLESMIADTQTFMDQNSIEVGTLEIMRQNIFTFRSAISLIKDAYLTKH